MESPSLSTYRPPEELEANLTAGPPGYFPRDYGEDNDVVNREEQGPLPSSSKRKMSEVIELVSSNSESGHDDDRDSSLDDIQAELDHYFVDPNNDARDTSRRTSLEILSDSDSEVTEDDDGRGAGDLVDMDEDDVQLGLLGLNNGMVNPDAVVENAERHGEGIAIEPARGDALPQGQAAIHPAAEELANNADLNEEPDANVEDDMEGAMEGGLPC
jgi:hypothetical protein